MKKYVGRALFATGLVVTGGISMNAAAGHFDIPHGNNTHCDTPAHSDYLHNDLGTCPHGDYPPEHSNIAHTDTHFCHSDTAHVDTIDA